MSDNEIQLALDELVELTGFKGSRSDFSYDFNVYLKNKNIGAGDAVNICNKIISEIKINPLFDIEKRLDELSAERGACSWPYQTGYRRKNHFSVPGVFLCTDHRPSSGW